MKKVSLPWGNKTITLELPETWNILGSMQPNPVKSAADAKKETERSLANPIGSKKLGELAKGKKHIVLVIDDLSRPTPVNFLLSIVLKELKNAGASTDRITIVPALGLHRAMSTEEVAQRSGLKQFAQVDHDVDTPEKLAYLGKTSFGNEIWINKTVAEADLVVSIGCIEPHVIASFGGGYKNLLPGVAGRSTIAFNHTLNCKPATFNMVGQPIENNPMRLDLEEAGRLLKAPVFIVNAVLNSKLEVVQVVAGDAVEAHRAGVKTSASIYGVKIPELADVVITDSSPMDSDLRQGVKALGNTVRAIKPGGVQITLVKAEEGVGVFGLANRKLPLGKKALKTLAPVIIPLVPKLKLKGLGEEDRFFLYFALQAMWKYRLLMYAPTIPEAVKGNLPFVDFVDQAQDAIALASKRFPKNANVLIFPQGGSTYPILP
jgi:nickel-dependent lactate racemase